MALKILNLLQAPLISSAILLGGQAQAQENEFKPKQNNPNWNAFNDQNPWKPSNESPFIWNPDFNFQNKSDDDLINNNDDDFFFNVILLTIVFSLVAGIPLLMFLNLRKFISQKGKEFDEFLENEKSISVQSKVSTRKKSAREEECREAVLKILKQRRGIDPSIHK